MNPGAIQPRRPACSIYDDPRMQLVRRHSDLDWTWHRASTPDERFAFERALVEHEHPLAYQAGSSEWRFRTFAAEMRARTDALSPSNG